MIVGESPDVKDCPHGSGGALIKLFGVTVELFGVTVELFGIDGGAGAAGFAGLMIASVGVTVSGMAAATEE